MRPFFAAVILVVLAGVTFIAYSNSSYRSLLLDVQPQKNGIAHSGTAYEHSSPKSNSLETNPLGRLPNPTSHPWTKPIMDYSQDTFCEAIDVGCFKKIEVKKLPARGSDISNKSMSPKMCIKYCYFKQRKYAFLTNGSRCWCAAAASVVASIRQPGTCDVTCSSGEENCGGQNSVRTFFVKGLCTRSPFDDAFVASRLLGCFRYDRRLNNFPSYDADTPNLCLRACEEERRPLAIYFPNKGGERCICGEMNSRFNLTHKLKSCSSNDAFHVYRTTAEDKRCGNIRLLQPSDRNRTSLNSYPGSGNTWIRYLFEKASGIYTGSVYNDGKLFTSCYLGEVMSVEEQRSDVIKDHSIGKMQQNQSILVLRNPYRAFIAYANFEVKGHTGIATEQQLFKTFSRNPPKSRINGWKNMPVKLIAQGKPLLVIYFEDVVADPIETVRKMVTFAAKANQALLPADLDERLACLSQETTGLQKRASHKVIKNLYSKESISLINKAVVELRAMLAKAGVEKPLPPYELDPDYAVVRT